MFFMARSLYEYLTNLSLDGVVGRIMGVMNSQQLTFGSAAFR